MIPNASKTHELRVASSQRDHAVESALNSGMGYNLSNKYGNQLKKE